MKKLILVLLFGLGWFFGFSQSKLFKAIQVGDTSFVAEYISKGKDLNVLYKATAIDSYNQEKISYSFEVLEYAANQGKEAIVKLLLNSKNKFKDFQSSLNKAFATSISTGNMVIIRLLFDAGANVDAICQTCYGQTAIQTALEYSNFELFEYLLQKGASLNIRNNFGRTLLHSVAHTGNLEITKQLIAKGLEVNSQDADGATPLIYAASNGDFEMFKLLVEKGATLSIREFDGNDVMINAIEKGSLDIVSGYLINNKNYDINIKNSNNDTPLLIAAQLKQTPIVKILILKGADINSKNDKEETALLWAILNHNVEIAKLLIENGADLTAVDYLKPAKKYMIDQEFIKYLEARIKKAD